MNDHLMNIYVEELSKLKIPIVFKGAYVLNHILSTQLEEPLERMTEDIDLSLIEESDFHNLKETIEGVTKGFNRNIEFNYKRNLGEHGSTSITLTLDRNLFLRFDIGLNRFSERTRYEIHGQPFYGVTLSEIISDKTSSISSKTLYRRCKDMYDLYRISFLEDINLNDIIKVTNNKGFPIDNFKEFNSNTEDLIHAYSKLDRIKDKPNFYEVYSRVQDFIIPFNTGDWKTVKQSYVWSPNNRQWNKVNGDKGEFRC